MKALILVVVAACSYGTAIKVESVAPLPPAPVFQPPEEEADRGRVVVTDSDIEILETITWIGNSDRLAPTSFPIIDAVARTMLGNPSIVLMEVRGHSDSEEPDRRKRAELSVRRAEAVVAELVARGVPGSRLSAYGASDSMPVSKTDPTLNRRIDFLIVERSSD